MKNKLNYMCEYIKNVPDQEGKYHVIFKGTRVFKNNKDRDTYMGFEEDILRGR